MCVYFLAFDGNESCEGKTIKIIMDTFLQGYGNKETAMKAMDTEPTTICWFV